MSYLFSLIHLLVICGTFLLTAFMVCLALPQSPFRDVVVKVAGWGLVAVCGLYCISPIDVLPEAALGPFGLIDDVAALILAVMAAKQAKKAGESNTTVKA